MTKLLKASDSKTTVWQYWHDMNINPRIDDIFPYIDHFVEWHGFHPLRHLHGLDAIWEQFWQPLLYAMPDLTRRPYIFLGNEFEGYEWVAGTGDFVGTFVHDWLGIPATETSVQFRFGEFCKVEDDMITEMRVIVDLPAIMRQAGVPVLPPNYGRDIWIPGPLAGDGLLITPQNADESAKTLKLVEDMIFGGLNKYDQKDQASQGLERFWYSDMVWHGPVGIGSAYGLDEFKQNAQGPIVNAFPDRKGVGHQARIADGIYAASTGWPSLAGTHINPYMDWQPTGETIGWNIMDFWRRDGELLKENWVMIDLVGAALASDVDLLVRLTW